MAQRTCSIDGCARPGVSRGWCTMHYNRWYRTGTTDSPRPPVEVRFWEKVNKTDTCWLWTAGTNPQGYGRFRVAGRDGSKMQAHRFAYELLVGPIPEGLHLDHLCRVRRCVNPEHLEPVTPRENILRGFGTGANHARKTHCAYGHELTPENVYPHPNGWRLCRQCNQRRNRLRVARQQARRITIPGE